MPLQAGLTGLPVNNHSDLIGALFEKSLQIKHGHSGDRLIVFAGRQPVKQLPRKFS